MFHARRKRKKGRSFELSEESRPRLSDAPITLGQQPFPEDELEFEVDFLEGVLAQDPHHEDTLIFLGNAYTRLGRYQEGLDIDLRIVKLRPNDPTALYNLGCSYSLVGDIGKAVAALESAVEKGYADVSHMLQDPDLTALRNDPRFQDILARIAKG